MERAGPHQIIAITDSRICKGDLLERIELLAQSGVKAIILREKQLEASEYRALAQKSLAICARAGVACILHSFIEVARELKASALHCQSSQIAHLPRLRQEFATLGVSVHSVEEYRAAREWVDYVIVGHIFASACKEGVEPKGLKLLESIIALAKDSVLGEQCGSVAKIVKGTTAKVANLPQFLQSSLVPTAIPRILEEDKGAKYEKTAQLLESTFEKSHDAGGNASPPSLRDTAEAVARQSIKESTFSKTDSRNTRNTYSAAAECMDCHAVATAPARNDKERAALAGNDRKNATFQNEDSRENAQNISEPAQDSRILELESGLSRQWQGSYLSGSDRRHCRRIHDSSPKAQSTSQNEDSSPALQGLYAIGGISLETLPLLHHLPISGVCMRQALMHCKNPAHYVRVLREKVDKYGDCKPFKY